MTEMSVRGKVDEGSIVIDVLVSIFLVMMSFGVVFSSIRLAVNAVGKTEKNAEELLNLKNERAENFGIILSFPE